MLERKAYQDILNWHRHEDRKALLVTGARQVGKSFLIERLGHEEYDCFVEINLLRNAEARLFLAEARSYDDLIRRITLLANQSVVEGSTLVFLDEIQELPDLMTYVKFMAMESRFRFAVSGSLLGVQLKRIRSYPVGYVHEVRMYPLVFEEFCWAVGVSKDARETARTCCTEGTPVPDYLHEALSQYFRTYMVVGGMPEVVQKFIDSTRDFSASRSVLDELVKGYLSDIAKYAGKRALNVEAIFEELPVQLDNDTRRFVLGSIAEKASYEKFRQDFLWLTAAGIALKTDLVREPIAPLAGRDCPGMFKLYESDTGMLISRYAASVARSVYAGETGVNVGAAFENVVAQELTAKGYRLFYYMTKKRGEVDFVLESETSGIIPIEVKSGRSPHMHAALDQMLENPAYGLNRGLVLSRLNVAQEGKVHYLPWYALAWIEDIIETGEKLGKAVLPPI